MKNTFTEFEVTSELKIEHIAVMEQDWYGNLCVQRYKPMFLLNIFVDGIKVITKILDCKYEQADHIRRQELVNLYTKLRQEIPVDLMEV